MSRTLIPGLVLATGLLASGPGATHAADKAIGAIWEPYLKNPANDQWVKRPVFRCTPDGKVYADGKVVGSHKNKGNNVEIVVTGSKVDANNGTFKEVRVTRDSSLWEGTYTSKAGVELPVRLKLLAD